MTYQFLFPVWNQDKYVYEWPKLEVKRCLGKGRGVFAKEDLKGGTIIPFLGMILSRKNYKLLFQEYDFHESNIFNYIMGTGNNSLLNGHPELDSYNLFITSLVNEPEKDQIANCKVYILNSGNYLGLRLMRNVQKGEELTYFYGDKYYREYSVGNEFKSDLDFQEIPVTDQNFEEFQFLLDVANYKRIPKIYHGSNQTKSKTINERAKRT